MPECMDAHCVCSPKVKDRLWPPETEITGGFKLWVRVMKVLEAKLRSSARLPSALSG